MPKKKKTRRATTAFSFGIQPDHQAGAHPGQLYPGQARLCAAFFSFSDVILLLLEDGGSHVELLSIDKITGEERHAVVLSLVGNFSECAALDESRIILFTEEDGTHAELFSEYRRLTGFARVGPSVRPGRGSLLLPARPAHLQRRCPRPRHIQPGRRPTASGASAARR